MSIQLKNIFKRQKNIVIGSLHFPPLLGFRDFPGYKASLDMAIKDLRAYEDGGVNALFLENNYGLSHQKISTEQAVAMGYLIGEIRKRTKLPLGVSVLWNDYETAFALAKTYELQFIRIPVFVDTVKTYCGIIKGNPRHVQAIRKEFAAENVALFTDILVKHSEHISKHSLATAAQKAIKMGSDAVIVTGDWTGVPPTAETVNRLRAQIGKFPIFIGSGTDKDNVKSLLEGANGVIVSTSLKSGGNKRGERNVKGFEQRVLKRKVRAFMDSI